MLTFLILSFGVKEGHTEVDEFNFVSDCSNLFRYIYASVFLEL